MNITATNSAIEEIKRQLDKRNTPNSYLRLGVKGGACSGYQYVIEFYDEEPRSKDIVFEFPPIKIIIDQKSLIILNGTELDYEKTLMFSGFKFKNPNSKTVCGCGSSFDIK